MKTLKNGSQSLYLDIYSEGHREYEFLKLYLVPELTSADKAQNSETLRIANAIRARRTIDIIEDRFTPTAKGGRIKLFDYYEELVRERGAMPSTRKTWMRALVLLREYCGSSEPRLSELTTEWARGFLLFVQTLKNANGSGRPISRNSSLLYFHKLNACLNQAVRDGYIQRNPCVGVALPRQDEAERQFLTLEELRRLSATPCKWGLIRRSFLFACLTGLRRSDVEALAFDMIHKVDGRTRISFRQRKTRGVEYLDINDQAASIIEECDHSNEYVFQGLRGLRYVGPKINAWVRAAGINKHITFHCARHTFAIMMLELNVDLYTTSKLLGHRDIKTTQIYAKVLDKSKRAAVDKIPDIL